MRKRRVRRIALDLHGLSGRVDIFRLSGALKRDPAVDAWLNDGPIDLRTIAKSWFVQIRQCGDDVRELMHDGCPVACIEDAPFAYVNAFKNHVNVGFFYGAMLEDPACLLEGTGKRMRHVKLKAGLDFNTDALMSLVAAAYLDIKRRLAEERGSGNE